MISRDLASSAWKSSTTHDQKHKPISSETTLSEKRFVQTPFAYSEYPRKSRHAIILVLTQSPDTCAGILQSSSSELGITTLLTSREFIHYAKIIFGQMREDPHAWEFACGDLQNARIAAWETAKSVASDSFPHTEPCKHLIEALDPRDSCELLNHRIDLLCCVVDHLESDVAQADALDLQCWAENESMDLRSDLMTELETLGYSSSDIDSELDLIISQAKALTGSRIARHVDDPIPEPDSKKEAISAWRMRREQERMEREESQKRERAALLTQRRKSDALQATK